MNAEEIQQYCLQKNGTEESFPFDNNTLVFKIGGKIYTLLSLEKTPLSITVKTDPEWSDTLRENHIQIKGAYHMNKMHWNSVVIDGLTPDLIYQLIDHSYELIFKSLTKKMQDVILTMK